MIRSISETGGKVYIQMDEFKKAVTRAATKYAERLEMMITECVRTKTDAAVKPDAEAGRNPEDVETLPPESEEIFMETCEKERKIMAGMAVLAAITEALKELETEERKKTGWNRK